VTERKPSVFLTARYLFWQYTSKERDTRLYPGNCLGSTRKQELAFSGCFIFPFLYHLLGKTVRALEKKGETVHKRENNECIGSYQSRLQRLKLAISPPLKEKRLLSLKE
jgi:hypothetical protein